MAGKPLVTVGRAAAYALDQISKNTALDMLVDMVRGELGEDASDEAVLQRLQTTYEAACRLRQQKPTMNLLGLSHRWTRSAQEFSRATQR
jgi:hypothetical protein